MQGFERFLLPAYRYIQWGYTGKEIYFEFLLFWVTEHWEMLSNRNFGQEFNIWESKVKSLSPNLEQMSISSFLALRWRKNASLSSSKSLLKTFLALMPGMNLIMQNCCSNDFTATHIDWCCVTDSLYSPSASFHLSLVLNGKVLENRTLFLLFE